MQVYHTTTKKSIIKKKFYQHIRQKIKKQLVHNREIYFFNKKKVKKCVDNCYFLWVYYRGKYSEMKEQFTILRKSFFKTKRSKQKADIHTKHFKAHFKNSKHCTSSGHFFKTPYGANAC